MIISVVAPRPGSERMPVRSLLAIWGAAFVVLVVGSRVPARSGDEAARTDRTDSRTAAAQEGMR